MRLAHDRRMELQPPINVCPLKAQIIVETEVVIRRIRTLYGIERRKDTSDEAERGPTGTPESQT